MNIVRSKLRQTNGLLSPVIPIFVQVLPSLLNDRTEVPDSLPDVLRDICDEMGCQAVKKLRTYQWTGDRQRHTVSGVSGRTRSKGHL